MSALMQGSVYARINALISEYGVSNGTLVNEKSASEMGTSGSAGKDPGGYTGPTTHPSGKVDGKTGPATLGERAKENEKDVKKEYPAAVDNVSPSEIGKQDQRQYNIGTVQSATGEDHKTERNFKGGKDDPGTTSPANAEKIGDKYASMAEPELYKLAFAKLNDMLAGLANGEEITTKNASQQPTQPQAQAATPQQAAQAGHQLAEQLLQQPTLDKQAFAHSIIAGLIKEAEADADAVAEHLYRRAQLAQAQIAERQNQSFNRTKSAGPADMGAMAPSAGPGGMPGAPPPDMAPPPPDAGGGMPPPGAGGDPGAGGGDHEAALNELFNALMEMGIPIDELLAAGQQAGGAPGGMPPGMPPGVAPGGDGGPPSGPAGDMPKAASHLSSLAQHLATGMCKQASAVGHTNDVKALTRFSGEIVQLRDRNRLKVKSARAGSQERSEREEMKGYVREVCGLR